MYELAQLLLLLALVVTLFGGASAIRSVRRPTAGLLKSTQNAFTLQLLFVTAAIGILLMALVRVDLSLSYVAGHSSRDLPIFYRLTAVWAGNEGSLLFWSWLLALFTWIVMRQRWNDGADARWVLGILAGIQLFFLCLLVFVTDPFNQLFPVPAEGMGLNPLLQNPGMIVHPPLTYMGYVGFSIPFAYALAALITARLDATWIRRTRRWTLFSWLMLTLGTLYGAKWAYMELGWGGYWGWDPVENASLIPWLVATAFLHSVMIQERRGMLKAWNVILIIITFLLTIFGTFLTRSGILSSVHSFAGSGLGPFFMVFIGITAICSASLIAYRWRDLAGDHSLDSIFSRESSFLLNNWILVVAAIAVLWGTVFPLLSEAVTGIKISVAAPYFNRIMVPIGLVLLLLTGVGPLIAWRRSSMQNLRRNFTWPLVAGMGGALISALLGAYSWIELIAYGLVGFIAGGVLLEYVRGLRVRRSRHKELLPVALFRLIACHRRRYGGYIVHLGIAMMAMGFTASNVAKQEVEATLNKGEVANIGSWEVRFGGLSENEQRGISKVTADLELWKNGRFIGRSNPQKHFFPNRDDPMTEVDIRSTPAEDFYVILTGWENYDRATFKIMINPLVWWIWTGGTVLLFGTVVAGWPERRRRVFQRQNGRRRFLTGVTAAMILPLLMLGRVTAQQDADSIQGSSLMTQTSVVQSPPAAVLSVTRQILCNCGCGTMLVADCQCGRAAEMTREIEGLVSAGLSSKRIIDQFVSQFGRWILAAPTTKGFDLTAWIFPFVILIGGGGLVGRVVVRWTRSSTEESSSPEIEKEDSAADRLLRERLRREIQNHV